MSHPSGFRPLRPLAARVHATAAGVWAHPVYVDAAIHRRGVHLFCHMFSEDQAALRTLVARLHAVAAQRGGRPGFYDRKSSWPHYDLPSGLRQVAIDLGAVEADRYTTLEVAWRMQGQLTPERAARLAAMRARKPTPMPAR